MSAREMMVFFQVNQKAVTSLDNKRKSVSKSSQGTSARGLLQKNQAPRIKIPASKQKTTNINEKRGHRGSNWGSKNEKLTSTNSSTNEGSAEGSNQEDKRKGRGSEAHTVSTQSAINITGVSEIKTDEEKVGSGATEINPDLRDPQEI